MNQPPRQQPISSIDSEQVSQAKTSSIRPPEPPIPQWRRPRGVAPGTWEYVHERSIADHYDAFVADTPLCSLDQQILQDSLPGPDRPRSESIIDLGCGSGRTALPLAERGYDVIGVDLSRAMLEIMNRKFRAGCTAGTIFPVQANLVELGCFAEQSMDHAVCLFSTMGMIQGRANRRTVLNTLFRLVRPGGTFILHVHHRWAALREHQGIRQLARSWWNAIQDRKSEFGDCTYAYRGLQRMFMHRFSKRELKQDLLATGWTIDRIDPISIDGSHINRRTVLPGGFVLHATRSSHAE